ncbi:MAG TPA: hypothetical protein DEB40_07905 [Elusimicrobia bacterium]|nr:hypothetical protein [Elusimicrobiota bacterium]HBT61653.1 hypothetical protein [Elusimicrobiota bacterium]
MKLFAQHGALDGQKVGEGLEQGLIDGVIFSPRDITAAKLEQTLDTLAGDHAVAERLFDPQFYACFLASGGDARLGNLEEDYNYFAPMTRRGLEKESVANDVLKRALEFQAGLEVSAFIAPNILVPRSLNSIEAVIAKNFIRNAAAACRALKIKKPLYATLALSRDTLLDRQELSDFLDEITMLDDPPQGFYVLIGASSPDARGELGSADVLAAWMLLNHALKINGFQVINGYSDLYTPLLGAVGGDAGCTGWFSNLRTFSLSRFGPSSGGRLPTPRYLSKNLINRITFFELNQLRERFPAVLNGLGTDALYPEGDGSEPQRNQEVFQTWEALRALNSSLTGKDIRQNLKRFLVALDQAEELYSAINRARFTLDTKSNADHIKPLRDALEVFRRSAEVEPAA